MDHAPNQYSPGTIEPKWQAFWDKHQTFLTESASSSKPKYYVLDMFPYPSSSGLHVGHPEGYTATDIIARYKRARGFNVLHPMGWDAFGLPAEQYALQTGVHPSVTTSKAIETFKRQLKMLGFSYDWTREISTADPEYYKWTQWIFLKLQEQGLAYQTEVAVNWCPALKTVLANEEVVDGKSERGGHPVFRTPMKQWMLKITNYAERLLKDLDALDWPEGTKDLQRNWIGKSTGLQMFFPIYGRGNGQDKLEIFTTRPDTLYGVTFMVVAPEHPILESIVTPEQKAAVSAYQKEASQKSDLARQDQSKEKTGCFTGAYAVNPVNLEKVPIYISDYVMMNYGTGAIMAVPGHDERDEAFAKAYGLPVRIVIDENGIAQNSDMINGLDSVKAQKKIIEWAEAESLGHGTVKYRLRDWLFSRQRYWGEPFPILHAKDGRLLSVPDDALPVTLPEVQSYEPSGTGESPLAAIRSWVETKHPRTGEPVFRETDTMPGSAGSSWYFLRYIDPKNSQLPFALDAEKYWMPVDLYLGGPEHAVGHLLYSRFWMKVLYDCGLVSHTEPFQKLVHQGMILGNDGEKMSKSRGNVINPDDVVKEYGADTLRLYEMFMGPLERDKPWSMSAIEGVHRFLGRVWRLFVDEITGAQLVTDTEPTDDDLKVLHSTIKKVTEDVEALRFNTAISQMMVFVNHFTPLKNRPRGCLKSFVQLLNPFAPHLAEELWEKLGFQKTESLTYAPWPRHEEKYCVSESAKIAVSVLGKLRGTIEVPVDSTQEYVHEKAVHDPGVARHLDGKAIKKVIFVKNKIINFIV